MTVNSVSTSTVSMSFEVANNSFKFAKVVGVYDFKDGTLTYDVYPVMGLTSPRIILFQPIARSSSKVSLSKALLTMYELEKSAQFGFDSQIGYHILLGEDTYICTLDPKEATVKFIKTRDDSNEASLLFELDLSTCNEDTIQATFYKPDGVLEVSKNIEYRVVK